MNLKLPSVLYEEKDKPWSLGVYNLTVNKLSPLSYSSSDIYIELLVPFEAILDAKIKKNVLGFKVTIGCDTKFTSVGRLRITPVISSSGSTAKVSIYLPIPESQLDCDGTGVPITAQLQELINRQKAKWEKDLELEITKTFSEIGI